jgi:D-serine deaminase-like pyridoxal phosphate-dependent protein
MQLSSLETPCLVADQARLERNAQRMRARAAQFGVRLRPHLKTVKSDRIARIAHGGGTGPITVSTLREADYFFARGFDDITYAVCITPNKFAHAAALVARGLELKLLVASEDMARMLAGFSATAGVTFPVMIEIDCGDHRTGFAPQADDLVTAAGVLEASPGLRFAGLLTHGGHAYGCRERAAIVAVAEEERQGLLRARERLMRAGIEPPVLSSGSTPTAACGENFDGIDELRPGVYLAGDLFQAQLGACAMDDIAISVLSTVIAHDPPRNGLVLDAGALALSKDRSTRDSPVDYGYGLLTRADGSAFDSPIIVCGVSQEHGRVSASSPLPYRELPIGSMVRVLPNHACMTAASYDRYYVTRGGSVDVVDEWDKASGWGAVNPNI